MIMMPNSVDFSFLSGDESSHTHRNEVVPPAAVDVCTATQPCMLHQYVLSTYMCVCKMTNVTRTFMHSLGSAWLGSTVLLYFLRVFGVGCAGWLLGSCFTSIRVRLQLWHRADRLWKGMAWCDRLAAGCSGTHGMCSS